MGSVCWCAGLPGSVNTGLAAEVSSFGRKFPSLRSLVSKGHLKA